VNGNGHVGIGDAIVELRILAGLDGGSSLPAGICGDGSVGCADVDGSGDVAVADVVALRRYLVGLRPDLACLPPGPVVRVPGSAVMGRLFRDEVWGGGTPSCCTCDEAPERFAWR